MIESQCDVYAPCALGATLNADTIPRLRALIVAGSANNQLAETPTPNVCAPLVSCTHRTTSSTAAVRCTRPFASFAVGTMSRSRPRSRESAQRFRASTNVPTRKRSPRSQPRTRSQNSAQTFAICGSATPSVCDLVGEHLVLDPVGVREQVRRATPAAGRRSGRSARARPRLRIELRWWMRSSTRPSSAQLVVERRVERDREPTPSAATAQPSRPRRSTSTSSGAELVAGHAEAAVAELLELARARARRARRRAPCRASARAPGGSASRCSSVASTAPELDLLHAQLLGDLVRRGRAHAARPATTSRRSGWRSLIPAPRRAPGGRARRRGAPPRPPPRALVALAAAPASRRGRPSRARRRSAAPARGSRRGTASRARPPAPPGRARRQSVQSAPRSPFQKRRRERRMYQFERSSTNASKRGRHRASRSARTRRVISATSCAVRATQPAVERLQLAGVRAAGSNSSIVA